MVFYADALYLFDLERVVGASVECGFRLYPQQEENADNESWYRSPGVVNSDNNCSIFRNLYEHRYWQTRA